MMTTASHFIDDFADCLGNPDWLPFLAPPYQVEKPPFSPQQAQDILDDGLPLSFSICIDGQPFGHVRVALEHSQPAHDADRRAPDSLVINGINSGYKNTPQPDAELKIGREMVRRGVLFADQRNYAYVRTSIFTHDATSFWLGLGFRNYFLPLKPDWSRVQGAAQEIAQWQEKIAANPDAVWDFARTPFGKRVLFNKGGKGVLDLHDQVQRRYAFDRLHLPTQIASYSK
jgi:hypothetical protein